jgi:transposase
MEAVEAFALVAGHVDEELLLRNEYLAAENEILHSKLSGRLQLTNSERMRLAKLGKRLGLKALKEVAAIVKPETILTWYRKLVAKKFDGSARRGKSGRRRVDEEVEKLVLRMVDENPTWGYDRVAGALSNLGHDISDETVGNILRRNGVPPAPRRKPDIPWSEFIERHQDVIAACDFFTAEVLTPIGLMTYYVLFFIKIGSREVHIAGVTQHPNERWMKQVARNVTMEEWGFLCGQRYLIFDRDSKFCASFRRMIRSVGIETIRLPHNSPNLNAYAERYVRSAREECLSQLVLFGEEGLRRALSEFVAHYHEERNHQGKDNVLLFPSAERPSSPGGDAIECKQRLGGMLKYYYREAA